jgi:L-rhamnose mutarotase
MQEIAFTMKLKKGLEQEYKKRHDEIWDELSTTLYEAGIRDYAIYLDENTGILFAVQRRIDGHTIDSLPELPIMKKWWAFMADIMEVNPDNSPVSVTLTCMFRNKLK